MEILQVQHFPYTILIFGLPISGTVASLSPLLLNWVSEHTTRQPCPKVTTTAHSRPRNQAKAASERAEEEEEEINGQHEKGPLRSSEKSPIIVEKVGEALLQLFSSAKKPSCNVLGIINKILFLYQSQLNYINYTNKHFSLFVAKLCLHHSFFSALVSLSSELPPSYYPKEEKRRGRDESSRREE